MTSATTYFANRAKAQIDNTDILVLKGCEITVTFSHEELYGMGSIERQGIARHTEKVDLRIRAAKVDVGIASSGLFGLMMKMLRPTGGDGTVEDTNTVATFTIEAWITGSTDPASNVLKITVSEVWFENLPWNMPENDWVVLELTGHGKTAVFSNVAYPS